MRHNSHESDNNTVFSRNLKETIFTQRTHQVSVFRCINKAVFINKEYRRISKVAKFMTFENQVNELQVLIQPYHPETFEGLLVAFRFSRCHLLQS